MTESLCYNFFPTEYLTNPPLVFSEVTNDPLFMEFIHSGVFGCAITGETQDLEWHHIPYKSKGNAASDYYGILLVKRLHIPFAHKIGLKKFLEYLEERGIDLTTLHNQYMTAYIIWLKAKIQEAQNMPREFNPQKVTPKKSIPIKTTKPKDSGFEKWIAEMSDEELMEKGSIYIYDTVARIRRGKWDKNVRERLEKVYKERKK